MVVKNIDNARLSFICHGLAVQIYESGFCPDVVLGIKNGGVIPAEIIGSELRVFFADQLIKNGYAELPRRARPCSKIITGILKLLPYCLLDGLRIISLRFNHRHSRDDSGVKISGVTNGCRKVLIVDDAIDTGNTFKAVLDTFKRCYPTVEVKSVALTVTMDNPAVKPDFTAFNNHIILRLPWAPDAK